MGPGPVTKTRALLPLLLALGCGGTGPNEELRPPSEACASHPVTDLAVGEHSVLDPAPVDGCLRIPAAGAGGAEHLLVLASTNGTRSPNGNKGPFLLRASNPLIALLGAAPTAASALRRADPARAFDRTLRRLEAELAADPDRHPGMRTAPPAVAAAPPLGDVKSFKVCGSLQCSGFVTVTATARYIGQRVAVYLDNDVPGNDPLQDSDLAELGIAFDTYHYPIDTTAFGRESDQDANGVVIILMTDAVNDLTPDCANGRVVGYFFGGDLLTGSNSNRGEIFYTLVPAPAIPGKCSAITRTQAVNNLKPTLIHEFQHMISFNQHVLLRGGSSEDVWLNEALSHFGEELGGRLIPDAECTADGFASCRAQYNGGNLLDAYDYLRDPGAEYMVFPNAQQGSLAERGAVWLFLRWSLDQFAADTVLATALTRSLVQTSQTGVNNLSSATGGSFALMVPQWLLAVYLDDGAELPAEPTGRLRYKSWGLRAIWTNPQNAPLFPAGFPLKPPSLSGSFSRSDTLRAGSGHHFLIVQGAGGAAVDLQVRKNPAGAALDAVLQARFGLVRIR